MQWTTGKGEDSVEIRTIVSIHESNIREDIEHGAESVEAVRQRTVAEYMGFELMYDEVAHMRINLAMCDPVEMVQFLKK